VAADVDVLGGFPGSIRVVNYLARTTVVVTDRCLIVGEGTRTGFAIPRDDLLGVGLVRAARQAAPALVIRYQDGDTVRTFGIQVRGLARTVAGTWRAEEILRALAGRGVPVIDEQRVAGPGRLVMSWREARARAGEPLLWSGTTTAAVGGWFGGRRSSCRVWVTNASLFWCCREGQGVNRLALTDITDVRVGPFDTVLVSTSDGLGHKFDLPFAFPASEQRAGFLDALKRGGLSPQQAVPPLMPWARSVSPR